MKPDTTSQRMVGLDVLRCVAVLLVLGAHFDLSRYPGHAFLDAWKRVGGVGVDIFFVLSGFLVSGLLFGEHRRTGRLDVPRFLIRRGFKIYPAFWLLIIVTVPVRLVWMPPWKGFPLVVPTMAELLFIQNYVPGLWSHTWTLAVEEHFYLFLALLLGWMSRRKRTGDPFRAIPLVACSLAVACLVMRLATEHAYRDEDYFHLRYCGTHLRIDSLFFGVMLAYWWHVGDLAARTRNIPGFVFVMVGVGLLWLPFIPPAGPPGWASRSIDVMFFYLGGGALVIAATKLTSAGNPLVKLFAFFGQASYSIYLWHLAWGTWGRSLFAWLNGHETLGSYLAYYVIGACVFGWLMSRAIEGPALALREKLFPSRRPSPNQPSPTMARDVAG